jgi:hypothetical protein
VRDLQIIIRTMPERQEFAEYLRRHLPGAIFLWDEQPRTTPAPARAVAQFLRAMTAAGDRPSLQMEDDVILTQGFREKVQAAIEERPDSVIQFFSMRKDDLTVGSRWDRSFLGNLCAYYPPGYGLQIAAYRSLWPGKQIHTCGMDLMVRDWLKSRKERYWIHVPSLVDHRVAVSMIDRRRSSKRQSLTFRDPIVTEPSGHQHPQSRWLSPDRYRK